MFIFADQLSVNYIQYSHNCISMAFGIYILPFPLEILLPRYHCKTLLQVIGVKINKMWNCAFPISRSVSRRDFSLFCTFRCRTQKRWSIFSFHFLTHRAAAMTQPSNGRSKTHFQNDIICGVFMIEAVFLFSCHFKISAR